MMERDGEPRLFVEAEPRLDTEAGPRLDTEAEPRLFVEVSDLLAHFRAFRTPMGVARVQMAILGAGEGLFIPIAHPRGVGGLRLVAPDALARLMAGARAGGPRDAPDWVAALDAAERALAEAPAPEFQPGDRVACLGQPEEPELRRLRGLRATHGILLCLLFYDAIPLTVPEHCEPWLTQAFAARFVALCLQVDRVVAISQEAARDFRRWQRVALPLLDIPVGVVSLDAAFPVAPEPTPLVPDEPYVLCVSTLEARKNHALLLHAWLTLLRRHGAAVMPRLVLVGREGFGAEAALRLLRHAPELRERVSWLRDVGDGALAALYARSLFTVFNSFHEGWGLPVTEALAHGKLVIAPDHTSLREAGGRAAIYVASQSEPELTEAIWALLRDPGHRAALEAALPDRAPLRAWRAVAEDLAAQLRAEAPAIAAPRATLPLGWRIPLQPLAPAVLPALPPAAAVLAEVMREGEGWGEAEAGGVWLLDGGARLRFPLDHALVRPLLLLELTAPAGPVRLRMRAWPDGAWQVLPLAADERRLVAVELPAGGPGDLVVEFDTSSHATLPGEARRLHALLSGLMLCEAHDAESRLRYAEDRAGLRRPVAENADRPPGGPG